MSTLSWLIFVHISVFLKISIHTENKSPHNILAFRDGHYVTVGDQSQKVLLWLVWQTQQTPNMSSFST